MKVYVFLLFSLFFCSLLLKGESNTLPVRHPEQEATIQTERMKQKIQLTAEQEAKVYQINLRCAQERQMSNSRTEAMERIKRKDEELRQVLSREQYQKMRKGNYDRNSIRFSHEAEKNGEEELSESARKREDDEDKFLSNPKEKEERVFSSETVREKPVQPSLRRRFETERRTSVKRERAENPELPSFSSGLIDTKTRTNPTEERSRRRSLQISTSSESEAATQNSKSENNRKGQEKNSK